MSITIKNLNETFVLEALNKIIEENGMKCTCDICKANVMAKALNELKPLYVTSEKGEILSMANLSKTQSKVDVYLAVKKAIALVEEKSMH